MARGTMFAQLVVMLREEIGRSSNPAVGIDDVPLLKRAVNRTYEILYDQFDWPHLTYFSERVTLNAGQYLYDVPTVFDYEDIVEARVWYNGHPTVITRGVSFDEYGVFDSTADERNDPVLRWDVKYTGSKEQIEVWPVPASDACAIQFKGKKKFVRLVNDNDRCVLDDNLVVLHAAVPILARQKSADAEVVGKMANNLLNELRGRAKGGTDQVRMGLGEPAPRRPMQVVVKV